MFKRYYGTDSGEGEEVKVSVGYNLGGYNYWNGNIDERGYYVYVQLVKRETSERGWSSESFMVGDGFKEFVKAVKRRSKKAEAEADALVEAKSDELAERLAYKKGLTLGKVAA